MAPPTILIGGCQCRAIRYTINLPSVETASDIRTYAYCHCGTCRHLSGSAYMPFIEIAASCIAFETGGGLDIMQNKAIATNTQMPMKAIRSSNKATRTFCRECGSPIGMVYDSEIDVVGITVGSLDDAGAEELFSEEAIKGQAIAICMNEATVWGDAGLLARVRKFKGLPSDDKV